MSDSQRNTEYDFWKRVALGPGCWEWQGAREPRGYGVMRMDGKQRKAHRLAWEFTRGVIPTGAMVLHGCDNRSCVNPQHLYLGDHSQNMRDRNTRHRLIHGERHPSARLTPAKVREIRARFGTQTNASLAREFGITPRALRLAAAGKTWSRVA